MCTIEFLIYFKQVNGKSIYRGIGKYPYHTNGKCTYRRDGKVLDIYIPAENSVVLCKLPYTNGTYGGVNSKNLFITCFFNSKSHLFLLFFLKGVKIL